MKNLSVIFVILSILLISIWGILHIEVPRAEKQTTLVIPSAHNKDIIRSNQWFSSVYKGLPTGGIFALPISFRFTSLGAEVSYPKVVGSEKTVFATHDPELFISNSLEQTGIAVTESGDLNIKLKQTDSSGEYLEYMITRGVPYVHIHSSNKLLSILPKDSFKIEKEKNHLIFTSNQSTYVLIANSPDTLSIVDGQAVANGETDYLLGLLPDRNLNTELFDSVFKSPILGTNTDYKIDTFNINISLKYSSGGEVMAASLVHQGDQKTQSIGTYQTLRGEMKLYRSSDISYQIPLLTPPRTFEKISGREDEMITLINNDAKTLIDSIPSSTNYGLSTWYGRVSNLILLSDAYGQTQTRDELISIALASFSKLPSFYDYSALQNSLISKNPEFGNEKLNDHHFHYGYIARLGAILYHYVPEKRADLIATVNPFIKDYANTDKMSSDSPYLRNFDHYESHSWADGYAVSIDGNNHESSSEAINAWYGLYLWGLETGNPELLDAGLYLYNSEILGAKIYWWNIKNIYPQIYSHKIGSIIWSGKVDFSTWFGSQSNYIYGIQIFPLSPASMYLKDIPNFFEYEADFKRSGGKENENWGELFTVFRSFHTKDIVKKDLPSTMETTPLSVILEMIYSNTQP